MNSQNKHILAVNDGGLPTRPSMASLSTYKFNPVLRRLGNWPLTFSMSSKDKQTLDWLSVFKALNIRGASRYRKKFSSLVWFIYIAIKYDSIEIKI